METTNKQYKEQELYNYDENQKRRVAIYMRVSTDCNRQVSSYELQKNYYEDYLSKHPLWTLAGLYSDEGIANLLLMSYNAFNQMLKDCEDGKIDIIVVKSVSRFAKNIDDCINTVKKLLALPNPVGVYFETENIYTLNPNIFMRLDMYKKISEEASKYRSGNFVYSIEHSKMFHHSTKKATDETRANFFVNKGGDKDGNNNK